MTTNVERMLPLYEAKMIHHFDHRWATFGRDESVRDVTELEKSNPSFVPTPRYWVRAEVVSEALKSDETLLLGVRDITNSTNERTVISNPVPVAAVGNNLPIMVGASHKLRLSALLSSFALDFVARPKVGGVHLNFFIANQLAVLPPTIFDETLAWGDGSIGPWVDDRTQELVETSYDLAEHPFRWEPARRELLRAELDAAFFHLYGIARDDVDYIMETFPIVKRKDVAAHGEYRTKRLILEVFDAMQHAIDTGTEYQTILDPPPGHGPRHPVKES